MKKRYIIAFIITLGILWLTNPYWIIFKSKSHAHFEFYIFTIILICGYLLSLKLTEYLADFKTLKNQSRIEIIFLTIFFTMLFVPMSHIDRVTTRSGTENRNLAVYKPLFEKDYKINYNFGNNFNNWFNDRFSGRKTLITYFYKYKLVINKRLYIKDYVYIKSNNWILSKISDVEPKNINLNSNFGVYINNLEKFCNEHNVKLYVVVVPSRNSLYADKYLYIKRRPEDLIPTDIDRTNILYPYKEMIKASKEDYVYFKTDHHFTDYGALKMTNLLLNRIRKDFPQVKFVNANDYTIIESNYVKSEFRRNYDEGVEITLYCPFLKKYAKRILDTNYKYYLHKNSSKLKQTTYHNTEKQGRDFEYPYGTDLRVVQIGSSINENINDFLPYQFKHLKYIRTNGPIGMPASEQFKILKYYKKEIVNYKPNIMILCITYDNIDQIIDTEFKDAF